jgi:hypothetical protein
MSGLFEQEDPQPKKKAVDRMLSSKPSKDQLLASMVKRGGGADFLSVDVAKKKPKVQEKGLIEPPIDYIGDEQ